MHTENCQDKTRKVFTTKENCRRKIHDRSALKTFAKKKLSKKFIVLWNKFSANENRLKNSLFIDLLVN